MRNACRMHMQSYSIFLFEIDSRRQSKFKKGHARAVNSIALNAEESRMASAGDDQKVILWDLTKTSDRQVAVLSGHKMPMKDFIFFTNFESEKTRNSFFFFANFRKLKKTRILFFANFESEKTRFLFFCKL